MSGDPARLFLQYVASHVRRGREALGLTQEEFAEKAEFDLRFFRFIETGARDVAVSTLVRLAKALDCTPADLLQPAKPLVRKAGRPKKTAASPSLKSRRRR